MLLTMRGNWNLCTLLVGMQNVAVTLENSLAVPPKVNILTPCNPTSVLLGIYLNKLKTYVHTKPHIWMFTAALFIIVKTWKQPRYLSVGECINCSTARQ